MDKLIVFPLFIMFFISSFGFFFYNSTPFANGQLVTFGQGGVTTYGGEQVFVDETNHVVCYRNGTPFGENGVLTFDTSGNTADVIWGNGSGFNTQNYVVGDARFINGGGSGIGSMNLGTVYGVVGVVVALMALAMVISLRVFGSGISDYGVDAFFKSSGYLTLWALFSAMGLSVITQIPWVGVILYFGLTLMYTLGTINSVGHPSGGD